MSVPEQNLPIETAIDEVRGHLSGGRSLVVQAEPGAGKSTVLPLHLIDEPWLTGRTILMLEPRRLAARAIARRMASLIGESVGSTVGLITRTDRAISAGSRLLVMTEGVLTRRLQRDPGLAGVGLVIFDEFHERSLHADLGLALSLEVQRELRSDLRIMTMSATIDTDAVAELMGGASVVTCAGRVHPVEVRWQPRPRRKRVDEAVADAISSLASEPGDILVFLPGAGEIHSSIRACGPVVGRFGENVDLLPLYGGLSAEDQDRALAPSPEGRRKIVFSTDIAETSLTVDGVRCIVDSGLRRSPQFDARTGMTRLMTVSTSRASADQRSGRAGRTAPGVAVRLWSKVEHAARPRFDEPEILQADLAGMLLEIGVWGVRDPDELALLDPPRAATVDRARSLLGMLRLLDDEGRPTALGRDAIELGTHPRLARMILESPDRWLACVCAALLEERDVLRGRREDVTADLQTRVELIDDRSRQHPQADGRALQSVRARARQLLGRVDGTESVIDVEDLGVTAGLAYPDRIARRRGSPGRFRLRGGSGAWVPPTDQLAGEELLVAIDLDGKRKEARIRLATPIAPETLIELFGEAETRVQLVWDDERDDLYERTVISLDSIEFSSVDRRARPSEETAAALTDRVRQSGLSLLSWTDAARGLQQRIAFIAAHRDGWPDLSEERLLDDLGDWLSPFLVGATSRRDLEALDLVGLLQAQLGFDQFAELDELAPARLELGGSKPVAIDYSQEPKISVRAQRLFGVAGHPSILGGRVPIVVEVLSPADRPIQVTTDLPGFWRGSWVEVRKEMAGRYPKHDWPVDPTT